VIYPEPLTWVAGTAELSETETAHHLHDPNTSEPLQRQRSSSSDQVDRAINAAWQAHSDGAWHGIELLARVEALYRFATQLEPLAERVAQLDALNSGVPISVTRLFASSMADTVRSAAELVLSLGDDHSLPAGGRLVRLRKIPFGPTALILPWNAPSAMAVKKLAFALAAGATTVIKPSPASPWSAQLIVEAAHES
jgi:betaine-aldehyde dehydrogenase